jgi:hypothetical protein
MIAEFPCLCAVILVRVDLLERIVDKTGNVRRVRVIIVAMKKQ